MDHTAHFPNLEGGTWSNFVEKRDPVTLAFPENFRVKIRNLDVKVLLACFSEFFIVYFVKTVEYRCKQSWFY